MSLKKFNHINHSIPLSRRKETFDSYDAMMECIGVGRVVEDVLMTDFIAFTYDPKTEVYCLEAEIDEDGVKVDGKLDCPRYAFAQLCRDILGIGDITTFIRTAHEVDNKLGSVLDTIMGVRKPSTENIDGINEIMRSLWDVKRTKNTRTASVHILRVFDFATASKDGDGRAIVTGKYIHKPDAEVMELVKEKAESVNENVKFVKGYATALMTRASFVDERPKMVNDREVLLGVSCANSEFKYSGLHLNGYLYIPEFDIELIGKTTRLSISLRHIGDKETFERMLERGVETILGLDEEVINLFSRVTTCESRSVAIDFNAANEKGSNALGVELGMTSKIKQLLQIKEERGYPDNIEGVALSLMDYSTHHTQDEAERDRINQTIMRVLQRPDSFVQSLGERVTRASAIDIDDEPEEADNGLINWV